MVVLSLHRYHRCSSVSEAGAVGGTYPTYLQSRWRLNWELERQEQVHLRREGAGLEKLKKSKKREAARWLLRLSWNLHLPGF